MAATGMTRTACLRRDPGPPGHDLPREVNEHWRLSGGAILGERLTSTWRAMRGETTFVVKHFGPRSLPDWQYQLSVADAFRRLGWPTPEPADEPLIRPDGAWVMFHWLPGATADSTDKRAEERARGRLLAEFHGAAAATNILDQRAGFAAPPDVVGDPGLDYWLSVHEAANPSEGRVLRAYRDASSSWFAENGTGDAPTCVIHGDFAPWNLLFDEGRLTGVLDFEASHYNFQVADFALAWRGDHDDVIRGYEEVRQLSEYEWQLLMPVYWSWLFLGVKNIIESHYGQPQQDAGQLELTWLMRHLSKESSLMREKLGGEHLPRLGEG
jgi:hypothetical protein